MNLVRGNRCIRKLEYGVVGYEIIDLISETMITYKNLNTVMKSIRVHTRRLSRCIIRINVFLALANPLNVKQSSVLLIAVEVTKQLFS